MYPLPVPASFDDLTPAWMQAALAPGPADPPATTVEVAGILVEPLGQGVGFLGDLARVHLHHARGTGPASVVVKLPPADPGGHQVGAMLRAWAREVAFYQEVAPASPGARVPLCHHAAGDEAAGCWVVVLEDCRHDPVDTGQGATPAQAHAAIDALAAFHATWWDKPTRFAWMPGFDTTGVGGLQPAWLDAHPVFLDRYAHLLPPGTAEWLQRFAPRLAAWSDQVAAGPLTVVHADYRLDNLLFSGGEVTMIDWQTALRGPGAMDVTSFLATSLTVEARRALEPELIDRYLTRLAAAGHRIDPDWFARSYDENLLWWMGQFAHNLARLAPADPALQRALDTMIERTFAAAADRNAGRLIDTLSR